MSFWLKVTFRVPAIVFQWSGVNCSLIVNRVEPSKTPHFKQYRVAFSSLSYIVFNISMGYHESSFVPTQKYLKLVSGRHLQSPRHAKSGGNLIKIYFSSSPTKRPSKPVACTIKVLQLSSTIMYV
jgi:hypothetical protein